jgi:hypothetical protein
VERDEVRVAVLDDTLHLADADDHAELLVAADRHPVGQCDRESRSGEGRLDLGSEASDVHFVGRADHALQARRLVGCDSSCEPRNFTCDVRAAAPTHGLRPELRPRHPFE